MLPSLKDTEFSKYLVAHVVSHDCPGREQGLVFASELCSARGLFFLQDSIPQLNCKYWCAQNYIEKFNTLDDDEVYEVSHKLVSRCGTFWLSNKLQLCQISSWSYKWWRENHSLLLNLDFAVETATLLNGCLFWAIKTLSLCLKHNS